MRLGSLASFSLTLAALSAVLAASAQTAPKKPGGAPAAAAASAVLRVACDGAATGAEVMINGVFKGECPLDVPVPAGTIKLRVVKKAGGTRESVFEQEFRMTADTAKRVEVELGAPQFTAEGQQIENQRLAREKAEAQRQADEKQRLAEIATAQAIKSTDVVATAMLAEERARQPSGIPDCIDCPAGEKNYAGTMSLELPTTTDATVNTWLQQARQAAPLHVGRTAVDFRPPAQALAMPCESAAGTMRSLARLVISTEEQQQFRSMMQQHGANPVHYVRDAKLWPVQASCVNDKLDGPLEFWAFGVSVTSVDSHTSIDRHLHHIRTTVSAGKQAGPLFETKYARNLTRFMDPKIEAGSRSGAHSQGLLQITLSARDSQNTGTTRSSVVLLSLFHHPDLQTHQDTPFISFVIPTTGDRGLQTSYQGLKLQSKSALKQGKKHGEMALYVTNPPTIYCWQDGESVKISPCNVN